MSKERSLLIRDVTQQDPDHSLSLPVKMLDPCRDEVSLYSLSFSSLLDSFKIPFINCLEAATNWSPSTDWNLAQEPSESHEEGICGISINKSDMHSWCSLAHKDGSPSFSSLPLVYKASVFNGPKQIHHNWLEDRAGPHAMIVEIVEVQKRCESWRFCPPKGWDKGWANIQIC